MDYRVNETNPLENAQAYHDEERIKVYFEDLSSKDGLTMTETMTIREELKSKLEKMNVPDKDVRMFEIIQKYKDTPHIITVLKAVACIICFCG